VERRDSIRIAANAAFVLAFLHIHIHIHHFHGPAIDYIGLAVASAASWVGVPGPGEPVLIATAVLAAKHHLGIVSVLFVAFVGAAGGGIAGWLIGLRAGRGLLTRRGPLQNLRIRAVARGDDVFKRYAVVAVLLTPSWIAGIHRVRASVFLPTNALGSVLWAGGIGMGAYLVGPHVVELVDDLGIVATLSLGALIVTAIAAEIVRRRRRRAQQRDPAPD
jgi:membrane protein DedA with SNARE-associated domain